MTKNTRTRIPANEPFSGDSNQPARLHDDMDMDLTIFVGVRVVSRVLRRCDIYFFVGRFNRSPCGEHISLSISYFVVRGGMIRAVVVGLGERR